MLHQSSKLKQLTYELDRHQLDFQACTSRGQGSGRQASGEIVTDGGHKLWWYIGEESKDLA